MKGNLTVVCKNNSRVLLTWYWLFWPLPETPIYLHLFRSSHPECSEKNMFLEIFQNSPQNTSARVSVLTKLQVEACNFIKKDTLAQVFYFEFREISKNTFFLQNTSSSCFCLFVLMQILKPELWMVLTTHEKKWSPIFSAHLDSRQKRIRMKREQKPSWILITRML